VHQQAGIRVTKSTTRPDGDRLRLGRQQQTIDIAKHSCRTPGPDSRVNGSATLSIFGSQYAMRIWLDPKQLNSFALAPLRRHRSAAGARSADSRRQLGGTPAVRNQQLTRASPRRQLLRTPEEFSNTC